MIDFASLYRKITYSFRRLPDFIMIGAQRAGTSSLYYYLTQHPQVLAASRKELHFFDAHYHQGAPWYRAQFPLKSSDGAITGEATPYYLFHPFVPERIKQLLPQAKLILLLRNPVERAISHYYFEVARQNETLSLEEALAQEDDRIDPELEKMQADESYLSHTFRLHSYKRRGIYVDQIRRYHQHFDPNQMLILSSEAFFADTPGAMKSVFTFLDVDPDWSAFHLEPKNTGKKAEVPVELRRSLQAYFAPHNRCLYEYLGRDFHWD